MGSHQVVVIHSQNRYSGSQHMDTKHETEYSQTMVKKTNENVIKVDIAFYHPDDDETKRVYDIEGMTQEFEYKLDCVIKNAGL
jgi:myo-inositol catabolism protein IolC